MNEKLKQHLGICNYREKHETVEAKRWWGAHDMDDIHDWIGRENYVWEDGNSGGLFIHIDETSKEFTVQKGEWIIKTASGEIIPCKNDIFEATYEPTTNCSTLENDFTARKTKWGSWNGDIWEVNNKHGELVGHITEFGFKPYDQPLWCTPLELRQLANLVEETLEVQE